jgi:uncharacterized oxidoreductase
MNTSGNTILITGGTSGIGLGLAKAFAEKNNQVIICGRRKNRLDEIASGHEKIVTKVCDISDGLQREELAQWCIKNYPAVNIIINNAGVQLTADLKQPADLSRLRGETETNFIAPVHLSTLFSQHLMQKENAAIINISSGLAFVPIAFMPVYCATKAAIHSFSLSLRYQLRNTSIKVFEIAPPAVDTELGHDRREDKSQLHGGMPVNEFVAAAIKALEDDQYEAPVGMAMHLHEKRELAMKDLNAHFN